jgi:hypothetical protein
MFFLSIFRSKNRFAYVVCWAIGFGVSLELRPAVWAYYAGMLLTYHLFLAWLIFTDEKQGKRSQSIPVSVAVHLGCIVLLVAARFIMVGALVLLIHSQPKANMRETVYIAARLLQIAQALLFYWLCKGERKWLFAGERKMAEHPWLPPQPAASAPSLTSAPTSYTPTFTSAPPEKLKPAPATVFASKPEDEHSAWMQYLATRKLSDMKRGMTVKEEFEQWRKARERNRAVSSSADTRVIG